MKRLQSCDDGSAPVGYHYFGEDQEWWLSNKPYSPKFGRWTPKNNEVSLSILSDWACREKEVEAEMHENSSDALFGEWSAAHFTINTNKKSYIYIASEFGRIRLFL